MPNLATVPGPEGYGFDPGRSLLVVPLNHTVSVYLICGRDLDVTIDKENIATWSSGRTGSTEGLSDWEKAQDIRKLVVKGISTGQAELNAYTTGGERRPFIEPLKIRVVESADRRQGADNGKLSPEFIKEVKGMTFRQALLRVAEDQMYSSLGRSGTAGNGRYDDKGINWCGSFVYWCYATTSLARGVPNPFGNFQQTDNPLRSGIKALAWGLAHPALATVIGYEGYDRFGGLKTRQNLIRLSPANPVLPGDICLPRHDSGDTFPHVCMVKDAPGTAGGAFTTIDGNQLGAWRPEGASPNDIGINTHNASDTLTIEGKTNTSKFVFIHMTTLDSSG